VASDPCSTQLVPSTRSSKTNKQSPYTIDKTTVLKVFNPSFLVKLIVHNFGFQQRVAGTVQVFLPNLIHSGMYPLLQGLRWITALNISVMVVKYSR
jgi:hypothetical protein